MLRTTPLALLVPALAASALVHDTARADDTGDAPDSYGDARHGVVASRPYLGMVAPDDNAPAASLGADSDDITGADDEDGVFAFPTLVQDAKAYGTYVFATNPLDRPVPLYGWVDFDGDGAFQADEAATLDVPAGAANQRLRLRWRDLEGITTGFMGETYARFRITSDALSAYDIAGFKTDGEVEDYALAVQSDVDGDGVPDDADADNDNDGIPDAVEVVGTDTDGDGQPDYLDSDSDGDGVADFAEAGADPTNPVDTDGDGSPDYRDLDSDNDGTPDGSADADDADGDGIPVGAEEGGDGSGDGSGGADDGTTVVDSDGDGVANDDDLDADNDGLHDSIETDVDTDGDGVADFLDLDSDNDGISDLVEGGGPNIVPSVVDTDADGRVDAGLPVGENGLLDAFETEPESGVPTFAPADTDADGTADFRDADSDGDATNDVVEAGLIDEEGDGYVAGFADTDGDGVADTLDDADGDGRADGAGSRAPAALPDTDDDGTPDYRDADAVGAAPDTSTGGTGGDADGTTDDGTDGGTPDTDTDAPADDDGRTAEVRTGLDGGAGCSISGARTAADPSFALLLAGIAALLLRRRGRQAASGGARSETTV